MLGFAGILGLSARFTGGGTVFCFSSCGPVSFCVVSSALTSERSALGFRGAGVEERLECWDMSSRTLPNGVLSRRSGDLEELLSKNVRGGDRGDSILTEGVS